MEAVVELLAGGVRRHIEDQLLEASFEVVPEMDETERVAFLATMMDALAADDVLAMLR